MNLAGKRCLVTGGARGIGRAIVEAFVRYGAKRVYACDLDREALDRLETTHAVVTGVALDVTEPDAITACVDRLAGLDVLVNNAGITRDALVQNMSDDEWDAVIAINLKGVFNMTRAVAPLMMRQGSGSIVSIASVVGLDGNVGQSNYAATKAGVIGMTKTWAKEFARKGAQVRANAVAPGFIDTAMIETVPQKVIDALVAKTALHRLGEVTDVADAVSLLAGDAASFITGQVLRVDGGLIF